VTFKSRLRPFVPPIVVDIARRVSPRAVRFSGNYDTWDAASSDAGGYDSEEILRRVASATRKVEAGEATFERDSVVFDHVEYSWPLLASLLQVALEQGSLRVIDFGGALGSTWRQNRRFLERLPVPVTWHVVEQEHFVALGRKEFSTDVLHFDNTIAEAAGEGADVVLFSSSLCYVGDPARFLHEAKLAGAPFLIIDRLPLVQGGKDRIALQSVGEPIYTASYPVRMFAEENLLEGLLSGWRLIETWDSDLQPDTASRCRGFFLEKR
jgi:putative methyltransferase (TIGR04325 family)